MLDGGGGCGLGDRRPAEGGGCVNCPIGGGCPEDDFGLEIGGCWSCWRQLILSFPLFSLGAEMVGVTSELRSPNAALFRVEDAVLPVCCAYSAFFWAMAAAASGNMALMVELSRPEFLLLAGETGGRPTEFREFSTLSFDIASLNRLDMASASHKVSRD